MTKVTRQDNESAERMIGRFRKVVMRYGEMKRAKKKAFHHKKVSKKQEKEKAIYREKARAEAARTTI
ncbi:MAG: 30S ribosomal protein S21 [Candidatus Gracilibacteria bacterium]|nr:30S ribosomal protein S21 [Candidatus Gracilibacteria bacterium]